MSRLSHRDYDALLRTILEMHERAVSGSLLPASPQILAKLIPCDYFAILDAEVTLAPVALRLTGAWETSARVTQDIDERMTRHFPTHPFTRATQEQKSPSALLFSDFFSVRELRNQAFYCELYRFAEIGRSVAIASPTARGVSFLSGNRREDERDVE